MDAISRRLARLRGKLITSASTARIFSGKVGQKDLLEAEIIERVSFLSSLTSQVAQKHVSSVWNKKRLESLFDGDWPSFASVAVERCYGRLSSPRKDVYMPSRALRIAQAQAGETLRSAEHSYRITEALLAGQEPPPHSDRVSVRNAHRMIRKEIKRRKHAGTRKFIPTSFFEVRTPPELPASIVRLDPTDEQLAFWQSTSSTEATLSVKLPVSARPSDKSHWQWHEFPVALPRSVRRALARGASLAKPTLRVRDRRLLIDLATEEPAPDLRDEGPYFSLDWGEIRLLTGTLVWMDNNGELHTDGRPFFFNAKGIQGKLARLRKGANRLQKKIDHIDLLLTGRPDASLQAKHNVKVQELSRVWARYSKLSQQLAHAGALWATETALVNNCQGILTEDLKSLEARFPGNRKDVNARINHQVRGKLYGYLTHKAALAGLRFGSGHARGTSSFCPRCRRPIKHQMASNNPKQGRGWLVCSCGYSADRDHASTECIGARYFAEQEAKAADAKSCKGQKIKPSPVTDKRVRRSHRGRRYKISRSSAQRRASLAESALGRGRPAEPLLTNSSCRRAGRAGTGRCVRPGDAPREVLQRSGRKSSTAVSIKASPREISCTPARFLQGMYQGFTGQLAFTPIGLPQRTLVRHGRRRVKSNYRHPPRSQEIPGNR